MFIAPDFASLTFPKRQRLLDEFGTRLALQRDQVLCSPEMPAEHWFMVASGVVRQCLHGADGRRHIIAFRRSGDCFGLEAGESYDIAAEAVTDAVVLRYPLRRTQELARSHAGVAEMLHDLLRQSLAATQQRLLVLGHLSARQRVAAFLLEMSDRLAGGADEVVLPMSRYDIGDYLGLSSETVCRVFTQLVADGVIVLPVPQRVRWRDRGLLEDIVVPA